MQIIDLTMTIDDNTLLFPGNGRVKIKQLATVEEEGCSEKELIMQSHCSTHIDAPAHMLSNGKTLDSYPMEKFVGKGIVIDVRGQIEIKANLNQVTEGEVVLFFTGWCSNANTKEYFSNNPVLSRETAEELVEKKVKLVGIDSFTTDNLPCEIHKLFFRHDILIVENLMNLDKILGKKFRFYVMPLKIKGSDGAPCRVIAEMEE